MSTNDSRLERRAVPLSMALLMALPLAAADPFAALHDRLEAQVEAVLSRPPRPEPAPAGDVLPEPSVLPEQLLWNVARVESGLNPNALSPKGARGMWQFMPGTARRFGLRVDAEVDERLNPARSGAAAARYLNHLHGLFGDWKLALAGYNAGEGRVRQAVERGRTRDFEELSRRRLLPEETRLYVPKVLSGLQPPGPQILIAPTSVN
jgi:hypothetical protein